ncbi:hypothetical protein HCH54_004566 [Aspergillus fumigatus]
MDFVDSEQQVDSLNLDMAFNLSIWKWRLVCSFTIKELPSSVRDKLALSFSCAGRDLVVFSIIGMPLD